MPLMIIREPLLVNKPTRTRHIGVIRHKYSKQEYSQCEYMRAFGGMINLSQFDICGRGHQYIDEAVKQARERTVSALRHAWGSNPCFDVAVFVWYSFGVPMPESWSKKKKVELLGSAVDTRPDEGNYTYALDNRLEGIAFKDDKLIALKTVGKIRSATPFTLVAIEPVSNRSSSVVQYEKELAEELDRGAKSWV